MRHEGVASEERCRDKGCVRQKESGARAARGGEGEGRTATINRYVERVDRGETEDDCEE